MCDVRSYLLGLFLYVKCYVLPRRLGSRISVRYGRGNSFVELQDFNGNNQSAENIALILCLFVYLGVVTTQSNNGDIETVYRSTVTRTDNQDDHSAAYSNNAATGISPFD